MITLAQAIPLRRSIERQIDYLREERMEYASVTVAKGEKPEFPQRTIEMITAELDEARADYLRLSHLIAEANLQKAVEWDGKMISLIEAIERAKQLREEASQCKILGMRKKIEHAPASFHGRGRSRHQEGGSDLITVATYDPDAYRELGKKLERRANLLSGKIEAANHSIAIDFDAARYMGE
ncbi:hypothetical protein KDJ56_06250 [Brevibacillus composti]|uniref:Uncharacterized protein n=1 Tax=Brevibacillus composti TaxID=2796470 RepID=A0A7T5EMW1_9BACL|nr:hypothetical protein [Brevibacillus composti]QQE75564.1 hypothetical protein JD108_06570 [Brevibacillus composti]QUO42590.1 hypothetical protein KDJ56_06250 [Brevibacillus composti]